MTTKCAATAIKEDLLEHARGEAAALRPEHLWHLESCAHCRAALERMRRLARTWRALDPTPREIAAARARFAVRRRRRQAVRLAPAVAALAVLLAGAAASAAAARAVALTLAHWVHRGGAGAPAGTPTAHGHRRAAAPGVEHAPMPETPTAPPERTAPPDGASADAAHAAAAGQRPTMSAGAPVAATSGQNANRAGPAGPFRSPHPGSTPVDPLAARGWTAAVIAMRTGDYARAERALDELVASSEPATRDAARLARAQLWLAQGRVGDARRELDSLSGTGATDFIRRRASEAREVAP